MKKLISATLILVAWSILAHSQSLTQTVRGTITDVDNQLPLIGAGVVILGSNPLVGSVTDVEGNFRLEGVPIGRIVLQVSYIGYESLTIPNVVVTSGKEVVLDLSMQESAVSMEEIVVTATKNKGEALNEMALVGARSISTEETTRFPGTYNDPSRVLANFAGVTSTQDGSNDIIVRGNSPKYVQWRVEGIQITNPNHFADQSAVGGAISILNNNLLATSDFYTGAFTAEYGDVLSGVYDVKLRAGNNEQFESIFGFGLLGTDFTLEGPLKKGYGGSYLVNYRYSTVSMIQDLGLIDIDGVPKFQDATFKVVLPTKKAGTFSLFGLGGYSHFLFSDVTPEIWNTPGDRGSRADIREDYEKSSYLVNLGVNHTLTLNKNGYVNTSMSYSNERIADDIYESTIVKTEGEDGMMSRDSVVSKVQNFDAGIAKSVLRGAMTYNHKLSSRHRLQVGTKYARFGYEFKQSFFVDSAENRITAVDFNEGITTIRNFISWKYNMSENLTMVAGLHNMNMLFNNKSTLEPRLALNWQATPTTSLQLGYGLHSTMESVHNYFARVEQPDGSFIEPNHDLGLLKAHHYVLGLEKRLSPNLRAKLEVYYQDLYDLPVENLDTSFYSTINEGLEFRYVDLVNEGTGRNYGIELTIDRFFKNGYYYMLNGSLYESKYTAKDGVERNSQYNGNYLINFLIGKEFGNLGRKRNQTLGLNAKFFMGGGRKIIPLLRDENGEVAVDPENNQYWDYSKAYENDLQDLHLLVLSASYKWDKPKATHEIFLTIDNITDSKGKISEFYDPGQPGSVGHLTQFGFFPNLMYRVYF